MQAEKGRAVGRGQCEEVRAATCGYRRGVSHPDSAGEIGFVFAIIGVCLCSTQSSRLTERVNLRQRIGEIMI